MTSDSYWWQELEEWVLADMIAAINYAQSQESVSRCDALCRALNKIWNAYYGYRETNGLLNSTEVKRGRSSDNQSVRELVVNGLGDSGGDALCNSDAVREAVKFSPRVMNMRTLTELHYDPRAITEEQEDAASKEHEKLQEAYECFVESKGENALKEALLKEVAGFIYVIRCNTAHGEKTPQGPDFDKVNRDHAVSKVASELMSEVLAILFDRPGTRLAVYGTLAPGEPNHCILKEVSGEWITGHITGRIHKENGLPKFHWDLSGNPVPVHVLGSSSLPGFLPRLDEFEGQGYRRSWIPVTCDDSPLLATVYLAADAGNMV